MRTAISAESGPTLVVVPTDPIAEYERAGHDWLERYFNPGGFFREVYALSPYEGKERRAFGMTLRRVPEKDFPAALREIRPDVVRAYGAYWPSDLVCASRVPGIPVVVSVHDRMSERVQPSLRHADLVVCMSKAVREAVIAVGVHPSRTRILPNRIDKEVFRPIGDPAAFALLTARFGSGRHILYVGRKVDHKNPDTLIRALQFLPEDFSCVLVGRGEETKYQRFAEEIGVAKRCFWVDSVKNSELPIWYSWCDVMCTPSRTEGFGIVFIEAAACGAAIVTSDVAPMSEYLRDGESACLVREFENPEALARAIRKVCEDDAYRRRISAGAIEASRPFERSRVDAAEVEIYREAMSLSAPPLTRRLRWRLWRAGRRLRSSRLAGRARRALRLLSSS